VPLCYKVLLALENIPAHVWSPECIQTIFGVSCLTFELASVSVNREDLSRFFVAAWAIHPDLIPNEVGCVVLKPKEQVVGLPPVPLRRRDNPLKGGHLEVSRIHQSARGS
jgi:hypothetical protein